MTMANQQSTTNSKSRRGKSTPNIATVRQIMADEDEKMPTLSSRDRISTLRSSPRPSEPF